MSNNGDFVYGQVITSNEQREVNVACIDFYKTSQIELLSQVNVSEQ